MSKTDKDLQISREFRKNFKKKYGEVFTSVWKVNWTKNKLVEDPRTRQSEMSYTEKHKDEFKSLDEIKQAKAWETSGRSVRSGAESTLPYNILERCLRFYSNKGDVFLDPTMGDMTVMTCAYNLERNFIGYDISKKNFDINNELRDKLLGKAEQKKLMDKDILLEIYNKSSESMPEVEDDSVDFIFFSPPYWDLEFYGDEKEQLGYNKTYDEFLKGMLNVMRECWRVLKVGKFCVINVNDFRKDNRFYDYHADIIRIANLVMFNRHDTIIMLYPNCIGQAFATQIEERKIAPKQHEYILVFKK
ncbi:hypothetical protein LCGC14_0509310 [marine sediment metagenome]|uniref:DNA methylase N-4/N-6 domain-containing protein n=1 Tax=marine sediment metagenome TaxID=412755 RepID=A0A0F9S1Q0_9ZZZZ|nr:hypothetical protein [bacterium]